MCEIRLVTDEEITDRYRARHQVRWTASMGYQTVRED